MCSFHVWLSRITFHREAAFQLSRKIAHKRGLPVRLSFVHGAPGVIYSFCKRRKGACFIRSNNECNMVQREFTARIPFVRAARDESREGFSNVRAKKSRFRALRFAGNKSEPVSSVIYLGVILPRALPSFRDLLRHKPLLSVAFERHRSLFSLSMFASLIVGQRFE